MTVLRARRGSLLWLIAIGLVAVVLALLVATPFPRGDDAGNGGTIVGPLAPGRMLDIVEELLGPA